jgi:ABC-type transporter Mla subunit MlaD
MIFVGVVSVSVLFQTIAMIGMAIGAAKTRKQFLNIAEELRSKSLPVLEMSREILQDTAPKLRVISDNVAEASFLLRDQAQRLDHVMKNTLETVDAQVQRADQMVSATLDGIGEITSTVQRSLMVPARQISGLMNGLRAIVEKLAGTKLPRSVYGRNEDDFV